MSMRQSLDLWFFLVAGSRERDLGEQVTGFRKTGFFGLFWLLDFAVAVAFAFGHGRFLLAPKGLFLFDAPDGKDGTGRVGKQATTNRTKSRISVRSSGRSGVIECGGRADISRAERSDGTQPTVQEDRPTPAV